MSSAETYAERAERLADWLGGLGLLEHLAEAGLPPLTRNCSGVAVWRDPSTGEQLTEEQLVDLDRMLHEQGEDPEHAVPLPLLQLKRRARLRAELLAEPWFDYDSLGELRGSGNTRFAVHKASNNHELLVVPVETSVVVPGFQLDAAGQPRPELAPVLGPLLRARLDPWKVWAWATRPAALLGGLVPVEAVLDPEEAPLVARAAEALAARSTGS